METTAGEGSVVHGTAELATGNREDLFQPHVADQLVNIVCGGCGLSCNDHNAWEEHMREMTLREDEEHSSLFSVHITSNGDKITSDNFRESIFKKFNCPECGRYFKTEDERDSHRVSVSTSVKLICPQCSSLAPDMELHLSRHGRDVQCGECGNWCGHINTHMVDAHSGYASVLVIQTSSCAGDGTSIVTREIALSTNARFLASEVKPVAWNEEPISNQNQELFLNPRFNKTSERDKALMPPDTLPNDFFDAQGKRIWAKLPSNAHQCELCGFKATTKNKYREKQDHVSKWHFSKRLEMIIPQNTKKPFLCPDCHYTGKDRQCVLRHYTGKHAVLELWTNEFLQAMNSKTITPTLMYLVENVNFNANVGTGEKKELIRLQKSSIEKKTDSFKCILCKDEPSFASKKGLALHVEMAHAHSRETTNEYLKKNIGFTFKQVVESSREPKIVDTRSLKIPIYLHGDVSQENGDIKLEECDVKMDISESNIKRPQPDNIPAMVGDVSIIKKQRRPPPGLIKINCDPEPTSDDNDGPTHLELREIKDKGLFCNTCCDERIATLQSFCELKNHIVNNHLNLLVEGHFIVVKNIPANPDTQQFTYYLCTKCGKCFSQSSPVEKLKTHSSQECNNNSVKFKPNQGKLITQIPSIVQQVSPNSFASMFQASPPNKLSLILKEISPSVSITPKSSKSADLSAVLQSLTPEQNMAALKQREIKSKRRDPCPCEYCSDATFIDIKLHKCYVEPGCDKTFSKIAHLKAHIRCHNNERPFECDWPGCNKTFVRSDELKRHAWIHTKEDRFKCPCGKGYSRADHYRAHAVKCDSSTLVEDMVVAI